MNNKSQVRVIHVDDTKYIALPDLIHYLDKEGNCAPPDAKIFAHDIIVALSTMDKIDGDA